MSDGRRIPLSLRRRDPEHLPVRMRLPSLPLGFASNANSATGIRATPGRALTSHLNSSVLSLCIAIMEGVQRRPGLPGNPSSGRIGRWTGVPQQVFAPPHIHAGGGS